MRPSTSRRWRAPVWVLATVMCSSLVVIAPAAGAPAEPCTSPPAVFPIDRLDPGMRGTGWTVLQGTEPESFTVKVLGVLDDAIAPGFDLILIKASGAAIDRIGGVGPGFSGSPVYRNGKLMGSVSWGLGGEAHYAALTPGQLLVDILMYPTKQPATRQEVRLSKDARLAIARDAGVRLAEVSTTLSQIPLPMAVAGASDDRLAEIQARFDGEGVAVLPYRASSTSSSPRIGTGDPIEPGDAFAAALSYGSIAYAGVGTATIVCGDYVVAFGHLFTHSGGGRSAAVLDAEVVTTVPAGGWYPFPFKIANVGELRGVLDQDRYAGIRGLIGTRPQLTEISSSMTNLDTGRVLDATTQVAAPRYLNWIAWDHVFSSVHALLDAHAGTAWVTWTVEGTSDGEPFSLTLRNAYAGRRVLWGPGSDISGTLRTLQWADGHAKISSIRVDATVTQNKNVADVHNARTASTTDPVFGAKRSIAVAPGDTLTVRVPIVPKTGTAVTVQAAFRIPADATGDGRLRVVAGNASYYMRNPGTITDALKKLARVSPNDELVLWVRMEGMARALIQRFPQDWVLQGGSKDVRIELVG